MSKLQIEHKERLSFELGSDFVFRKIKQVNVDLNNKSGGILGDLYAVACDIQEAINDMIIEIEG